ncbi:MAG: HAD family hydrolase [Thermodesulfobacteriota bacterium]
MKIDSIFFDFDGTLVDSLPGIQQAFESAVKAVLPSYPIPDLGSHIGPPIREIFRTIFKDLSEEKIDALVSHFRQNYDQESCIMAKVYPKVPETLYILNQMGIKCFLITNKPIAPTKRILKNSDLEGYFQTVISPDVKIPPFKNKIEMAIFIIRKYQIKPSFTLFVGDSQEDQRAAKESGTIFIPAVYGYGGIRVNSQIAKKIALSTFSDLLLIIGSKNEELRQKLSKFSFDIL